MRRMHVLNYEGHALRAQICDNQVMFVADDLVDAFQLELKNDEYLGDIAGGTMFAMELSVDNRSGSNVYVHCSPDGVDTLLGHFDRKADEYKFRRWFENEALPMVEKAEAEAALLEKNVQISLNLAPLLQKLPADLGLRALERVTGVFLGDLVEDLNKRGKA